MVLMSEFPEDGLVSSVFLLQERISMEHTHNPLRKMIFVFITDGLIVSHVTKLRKKSAKCTPGVIFLWEIKTQTPS